jgi:hypothetical protein
MRLRLRLNIGANHRDDDLERNSVIREATGRLDSAVAALVRKGRGRQVLAAIASAYDSRPQVSVLGTGPEALAELASLTRLWL